MFLVAALVVSAVAANAQATFGVKAGANFSSIKSTAGDESESTDMKVGLNIGGLANIPISDMFSFQPELVFSMEGGKDEEDGEDYKLNLNYINIPLLLQYNASGFIAETAHRLAFWQVLKPKLMNLKLMLKINLKK